MKEEGRKMNLEQNNKGWSNPFLRIGAALFVFMLLQNVLQMAMGSLVKRFIPCFMESSWCQYIIIIISTYVIGTPVAYMMIRSMPVADRRKTEKKPLKWYTLPMLLAVCMTVMNLLGVVGMVINGLIGLLVGGTSLNPLASSIGGNGIIPTVITIGILAPIMEELLFREAILERLRVYSDLTAIIVTSVFFGLLHGNIQQIIYTIPFGMILAYVKVKTNDIRYSVGLHMAVNLLGSVLIPNLSGSGNQYLVMVAELIMIGCYMLGIISVILGFTLKWVDFSKLSKGEIQLEHPVRAFFGNIGVILYILLSILSCVSVVLTMK